MARNPDMTVIRLTNQGKDSLAGGVFSGLPVTETELSPMWKGLVRLEGEQG